MNYLTLRFFLISKINKQKIFIQKINKIFLLTTTTTNNNNNKSNKITLKNSKE